MHMIHYLLLLAFSLPFAQAAIEAPAVATPQMAPPGSPERKTAVAQMQGHLGLSPYQSTPDRKRSVSSLKTPSPQKTTIRFCKFRTEMIEALQNNEIGESENSSRHGLIGLFNKFFNTLCYPMQIDNSKFYASVFYWVLRELGSTEPDVFSVPTKFHADDPELIDRPGFEYLRIFVKTEPRGDSQTRQCFCLEVVIIDGNNNEDPEKVAQDIKEIHQKTAFASKYVPEEEDGSLTTVTPIRFFLHMGDRRTLHAYKPVEDPKNPIRCFRLVLPEKPGGLHLHAANIPNAFKSPIHNIMRTLDLPNPNMATIEENLNIFYNAIPKSISGPFRGNCNGRSCKGRNEKYYHALFYIICNFHRGNYALTEQTSAKGRADIIALSMIKGEQEPRRVYWEFKHQEPISSGAKNALEQIIEQDYPGNHQTNQRPFLIGLNIRSDDNGVTCYTKSAYYKNPEYKQEQTFLLPPSALVKRSPSLQLDF